MYYLLLPVLLFGMLPVWLADSPAFNALASVTVEPPAIAVEVETALSASSALIVDAQSGQEVYAKLPELQRPMASLTKLMTALLIVENHDMSEIVTISRNAAAATGNRVYLEPGDRFTVGDLLSALLMSSANDAAYALAEFHSGSVEEFVFTMNRRAVQLGLRGTHYANPSGLDSNEQYSTPRDVAVLTRAALRYKELKHRLQQRSDTITSRNGTVVPLRHTHVLLHRLTAVSGGKTGTTQGAGECLVSLVEKGDRTYVVVLMRSHQRYTDLKEILLSMDIPVS